MKTMNLVKIACIAILFNAALFMNSAVAQTTPTILIGGVEVMANNITISPYWLYAGQTIATGNLVKLISVVQYNIAPAQGGGNSLQFESVLSITTQQAVPTGKAWKIESVGIDPTAKPIMQGVAGATGASGVAGTNGATGATGPTGPAGSLPASNMDFTLTMPTTTVTTGAGGNSFASALPIYATYTSGTVNAITLSVSGLPAGVYSNFSQWGGSPSFVSYLSFSVLSSVAVGTYTFTVTASGGLTTKTVTGTLKVVRIVFVTSTLSKGNIGGLSGADSQCNARAAAAGLPGSYKAWLSSTTVDAWTRITDATYVRAGDYLLVSTSTADLTDGTIANPINRNEFGATVTSDYKVWTNTLSTGTKKYTASNSICVDWTSTSGSLIGFAGVADYTDYRWTQSGDLGCDDSRPALYCFQQ